MKNTYRPDIDALRGVSIIFVVLYHAKFKILGSELFSGGFIGVDIFFIITGFLITKILLNEFEEKKIINIVDFYKRRIKRLIPVLVVAILIATITSYFVLDPIKLKEFSVSAFSSLIFIANAYFHYFGNFYGADGDILRKPLINLWSLGVEEQFYIFYPLFLIIILKYLRNFLLPFLLLGFFSSLLLAQYASTHHIMFNFYMLPTRAWEIISGSIIAYLLLYDKINLNLNKIIKNILYLISLIVIFLSLILFNINTVKHPSIITFIPLLAAALIIIIGDKEKNFYLFNLFTNKIFIFFGKISYSLYLWHYLFFSILRNSFFEETFFSNIFIIFFSIFISFFSYKFIENRHRNKSIPFKTTIKFICIFLFPILIINSYYLFNKDILKKYYTVDSINLSEWPDTKNILSYIDNNNKKKFPLNKKINVLIIGNCHAEDIFVALDLNKEKFPKYNFIKHRHIEIFRFAKIFEIDKKKNLYTDANLDLYKNADIILISTKWRDEDIAILNKIFLGTKKNNKKIVVFGNYPQFNYTEQKHRFTKIYLTNYKKEILKKKSSLLTNIEILKLEKKYYSQYLQNEEIFKKNIFLKNFTKKNNVKYIDTTNFTCNNITKTCKFRIESSKDEIYRDYGRHSFTGLRFLGDILHKQKFLNFSN